MLAGKVLIGKFDEETGQGFSRLHEGASCKHTSAHYS